MPDSYGFDHLPNRGNLYHRCIECEWPGYGVSVSEADRRRHHLTHTRAMQREQDKERLQNLAKARKMRKLIDKENP
jgi:hypothetical protein